ncbi:MAG: hypothetical protein AAF721_21475 [Myxococcota bacterium]
MKPTADLAQGWIDLAIVLGFAGSVAYAVPQFPSVTGPVHDLLFMGFGPLMCLWSVGSYHFFRRRADSVSNQAAHLFIFVAGVAFTCMATMQRSMIVQISRYYHEGPVADQEAWRTMLKGVMPAQLGLDFAFDIFVSVGTVLLGLQVARHPRFWRWFGALGVLIGAAGLTVNFITFPENSGASGLVDPGPAFGVWMTLVLVQMTRCRRWLPATR